MYKLASVQPGFIPKTGASFDTERKYWLLQDSFTAAELEQKGAQTSPAPGPDSGPAPSAGCGRRPYLQEHQLETWVRDAHTLLCFISGSGSLEVWQGLLSRWDPAADGRSNLELGFPPNKPLTYSIFWDISIRVKLDPSHLQGGFRVSAVSNGCGGQVGRKKKLESKEKTRQPCEGK